MRPVGSVSIRCQVDCGFCAIIRASPAGPTCPPGMLSGGQVVPAGLARMIAQNPQSTWHRMLTDPTGRMAELSTTSYRPTKAIWEQVVAEHGACFRPGCDTPATEAELDHRLKWPDGDTTRENPVSYTHL